MFCLEKALDGYHRNLNIHNEKASIIKRESTSDFELLEIE